MTELAAATPDSTPLRDLILGDIVSLPDGRRFSARARCVLPKAIGSIGGFVVLGELEAILTTPLRAGEPLTLYVPTSPASSEASISAQAQAHGSLRYWSPHLPPVENSMGTLEYEVLIMRGHLDPHLRLLRSGEEIYFFPSVALHPHAVSVIHNSGMAGERTDVFREGWSPLPPQNVSAEAMQPAENLYDRALGRR